MALWLLGLELEKNAGLMPAPILQTTTRAPTFSFCLLLTSDLQNVASLAEPSVAPRQNRAALLRAGVTMEEPAARNVAENAVRNKARDLAEREMRRKSVVLPLSLSNPDMLPRQNRAALLRLGHLPAPQGRDPRDVAEQAIINKEREAAERLAKRKSVALPSSLAAPTIVSFIHGVAFIRHSADI
jgi:hypothetical protein